MPLNRLNRGNPNKIYDRVISLRMRNLKSANKDFVNAHFVLEKYPNSKNGYLILKNEDIISEEIRTKARELARMDIARYNSNVGYIIDEVPNFYNNR